MPPPIPPSGPLQIEEAKTIGWVRFQSATRVRITAALTTYPLFSVISARCGDESIARVERFFFLTPCLSLWKPTGLARDSRSERVV
jgi:hypothetical protein